MTEHVVEEMMDAFRCNEQHWSRLLYLVDQVAIHCKATKWMEESTPMDHETRLSIHDISNKMLDEIYEMKQRQEHAMLYLQQMYAANLQCLMKITALKEENEQLKISRHTEVQKLKQRVSGALFALEEQESHYLKHFSHSMALEEFWHNLLPHLPDTDDLVTMQDELHLPQRSSQENVKSSSESRSRMTRDLVNNWENDCGKVMKYMSVYCLRRLKIYAASGNILDANINGCRVEDSEQFVQSLLQEIQRLGRKVDALRSSAASSSSIDSEDSLEKMSTKRNFRNHRNHFHDAKFLEMNDCLEDSRKWIEHLQQQLRECQDNLRKEQALVDTYKKQGAQFVKELEKKNLCIQRLEDHIVSLNQLLAQHSASSPKKQRTPPKLETILLSSPRYMNQSHPTANTAAGGVPSKPTSAFHPHNMSSFSPSTSFLDVENLWTPIKMKEDTPVVKRCATQSHAPSVTKPLNTSMGTTQSEGLLGEDLSLVLSSSSFHQLQQQPQMNINQRLRFDSKPTSKESEQKTLSFTCSNTDTVSFAVSSNVDESKTISPDASFADITLEDLANSKYPI